MSATTVLVHETMDGDLVDEVGTVLADAGLRLALDGSAVAADDVIALVAGPPGPIGSHDVDRYRNLQVVATPSTGSDHLDVDALERRAIAVRNVSDYCTDEVADHALAFVLALLRQLPAADRTVRDGRWDGDFAPGLLAGARLGIVGFGHIGQALAARARALGLLIWAHDPRQSSEIFQSAGVLRVASLPELLVEVDVVSLHVPSTPETRGLLGVAELALLRPGAGLVNVARGDLVESAALVAALESGHLSGAALDVFATEPAAPDDPLLTAPNTLLSPHIAWLSPRSERRAILAAITAVVAALQTPPDERRNR
jgi:D-3-phosphoglycerate dehydrogenase / 2-oxoglutarate reductase